MSFHHPPCRPLQYAPAESDPISRHTHFREERSRPSRLSMQGPVLADKAELALPLEMLQDMGTHMREVMSLFL